MITHLAACASGGGAVAPTVTLTPTPTEAPLPELGSFWQEYVDAHSKEVSVKVVDGAPSLVGTMSNGQEVTVAKYKDGKWVSLLLIVPIFPTSYRYLFIQLSMCCKSRVLSS